MNLERLSPKQQRLLALGILAGVLVIAIVMLVMPLLALADSYDAQIRQLRQRLASAHRIMDEGATAQAQLRQVILAEKRNGYYLENDKETLAAAELQRRVKQIVEQQGGAIVSSQILGEQEDEGLQRVVLRVNLRMGLPALEKILFTLETQPPVLLLDNVTIVARPSGSTARWRGSQEQQELDASLDVMAYRKVATESES